MSSTKRRKLNLAPGTPLSAVAARKALKERTQQIIPNEEHVEDRESTTLVSSISTPNSTRTTNGAGDFRSVNDAPRSPSKRTVISELGDEVHTGSFKSREQSPEISIPQPSMVLSTIKPSKETLKERSNGSISLRISPGERLVVLGQYGLSVKSGQVTLFGSTLRPSKVIHKIYAPSSHALPVIRCLAAEIKDAEIQLHQCQNGIETLNTLSPLFGKLWNDGSSIISGTYHPLFSRKADTSFQILFSSNDGPKKSFLQPLISPPEWNEVLAKLAVARSNGTLSIMLCGPKSSGKSTFAKMLGNRILSTTAGTQSGSKSLRGVAILDIDPGQPEFTTPGFLSLVHLKNYNFGPPFSHPASTPEFHNIRSHSIAATSPSLDPTLYMACTLDLFTHYRKLLSKYPKLPLIINTPGWVLGTGLEILVDLITQVHPTDIIYMSQDGPPEVVRSLRDAGTRNPVYTIPSQGSEYATRTAAHLRTMQTMSYFHLDSSNAKKELTWKDTSLTSAPPWQIPYSGLNSGILGILCYGEQPPADLLADAINGSLVSVVVVDDFEAIPGWGANEESEAYSHNQDKDADTEIRVFDDETLHPSNIAKPLIIRTPDEDLPYFNPANCISLDPKFSHSIGVALVRGIDIAQKRLQVLTSIPHAVIEEINKADKAIVLVSGKLDTPGWAYTEGLVQKEFLEKVSEDVAGGDDGHDEEVQDEGDDEGEKEVGEEEEEDIQVVLEETSMASGDGSHSAPWVETLHGSQGRGVGSRVWRVRRDLGRDGGNGD